MAQYKVPQDVEADDKLLGPFSFRQFVYLLIAGGLLALLVGLFQLFPLLAIIPAPFILLFLALALPLKKDQPMETYLVAVVSYYLKPKQRFWKPGQADTPILIMAPKKVEDKRTRDLSEEEASHRLSFLADIVDTEGQAIKGMGFDHTNMELAREADRTRDMFENSSYNSINEAIRIDEDQRHAEVIQDMQEQIKMANETGMSGEMPKGEPEAAGPDFESEAVVQPGAPVEKPVEKSNRVKPVEERPESKSMRELANNADYTVATIAKEANRIKEKERDEVFISLH